MVLLSRFSWTWLLPSAQSSSFVFYFDFDSTEMVPVLPVKEEFFCPRKPVFLNFVSTAFWCTSRFHIGTCSLFITHASPGVHGYLKSITSGFMVLQMIQECIFLNKLKLILPLRFRCTVLESYIHEDKCHKNKIKTILLIHPTFHTVMATHLAF